MYLENQTFVQYGYQIDNLSNNSNKPILIRCDYCGIEYTSSKKRILHGRIDLPKDACVTCRFKKRTDISLLKYGVKNSAQRNDVKQKIRESNSSRLQSIEYKEKVRASNILRYGTENPMQSDSIKNKQQETLKNRYGVNNPMKISGVAKLAAVKMLKTKINNGTIQVFNNRTIPDLAEEQGFSRSHFGKLVNKYGIEYALNATPKQSNLESLFEKWLTQHNILFEKQFKVSNYIADFKICNILIELDGLYWHSDAAKLSNKYHSDKRNCYVDSGYYPLFFREDELRDKFDIVTSVVLNKIGINKRIFGRKCQCIISTDADFFKRNHLMGKGYGTIFGLEYDGELVAAMQVRRLKNREYEISRFCNKLNHSILGSFSKILKFVEKSLDMTSLKTFIDLRYGVGTYLSDYGFQYKHTYNSFKWTNGKETYHRLKFRGNSGYQFDLHKIWDCGQSLFVKEY